ncbi:MAG: DUF1700 domain-containing protein [Lachnospiraceae bacterium]|nr:DUF1700 domain-containing protein [Lachnospiraceae bacterium]
MTKRDFIKKLEDSLSASMTSNEVYSQVTFYEEYIDKEIKNGKSESEVLDELGDPILIAKTIKQVNPTTSDDVYTDNNSTDSYHTDDNYHNRQSTNTTYKRYYDKTGLGCALFGIIALIIVFALLRFLGFIVGSTFIFFSPISIIVLIIILFSMFRGGSRQ